MKPSTRVLLVGAAGRMGKTVLDLARTDGEIEIVAQCDLGDAIQPVIKNCDVAIDFSHADAIDEICRAALHDHKPLVIGTTGHSQQHFSSEIIETHHKMKKDAPSGTAKTLAEILRATLKIENDLPIQSIREGEIVGEHTVIFSGPGERLELTHRAASREIFARGALRAAKWIIGKPPGLYSMQDVLGL